MANKPYLFILESPSAFEMSREISEGKVLSLIGKMSNVAVMHQYIFSKTELKNFIEYINAQAEMDDNRSKNLPIIIHISAHGNGDELQIGKDAVNWESLAKILDPLINKNSKLHGTRIITLSSCNSVDQSLHKSISPTLNHKSPAYIFTNSGEPSWVESSLQWASFYSKIFSVNFNQNEERVKKHILKILDNNAFPQINYARSCVADKTFKKYNSRRVAKI